MSADPQDIVAANDTDARQGRLDGFAARLAAQPWFSALAQPPTGAERADAVRSVEGLLHRPPEVLWMEGLAGAAALLKRSDQSRAWMQAEADEERRLTEMAEDRFGAAVLTDALNRLMRTASDAAVGPAAVAFARGGIADEALPKVAAGAVAQTAVQMALVIATDQDQTGAAAHPFAARHRLFTAGRWPLTVTGNQLHVI